VLVGGLRLCFVPAAGGDGVSIQRIETKRGHTYKLDGQKTDGVTTILSNGLPKPALLPWGIKSVAEYAADHLDRLVGMQPMGREAIVQALKQAPYTERDTAAKRGTEVHNIAEHLVHGDPVDVPEDLAGHVNACVRFLDEWQAQPVAVERVVASRKWRYMGTFDLVADLADGTRALIDWKTGRSGIYAETVLQLAGYRYAEVYDDDGTERPMADLGINRTLAVWLRPDGTYCAYDLPADERAFKDFLHVRWVAQWMSGSRDLCGDPVPAPTAPGQLELIDGGAA
jgi:hypothetical protein